MLEISTVLQELKRILTEQFQNVIKDVVLFGSRASGTAHADSDYDVLIVLKRRTYTWKEKKAIRYACYDVALRYDIFLDVKVISQYELDHTLQGTHPLFTEALAHGVYA